jgi:AcrR family transcriptional regulator
LAEDIDAPALDDKARSILRAAAQIFRSQGYGGTSMDAVSHQAGASKATVYAHFGSKAELFGAVIEYESRQHTLSLGPHRPGETAFARLHHLASSITRKLREPRTLELYRTVLAEAARFPELGQIFYDAAIRRSRARMSQEMAALIDAGILKPTDPAEAAFFFSTIVRGDLHLKYLMNIEMPGGQEEESQRTRRAVEVFLAAFGTPGAGERTLC